MITPNVDHFGMEVSSKGKLVEILDRVKEYQRKDDRVRVTDVGAMVTRYQDKEYMLTNAYIWFLIPMWIELQHVERRTGGCPPAPARLLTGPNTGGRSGVGAAGVEPTTSTA